MAGVNPIDEESFENLSLLFDIMIALAGRMF